jgi:hypothetical protein
MSKVALITAVLGTLVLSSLAGVAFADPPFNPPPDTFGKCVSAGAVIPGQPKGFFVGPVTPPSTPGFPGQGGGTSFTHTPFVTFTSCIPL